MDFIRSLIAGITILYMLATGDFPGWAPWQEDSPIVAEVLAVSIHPPTAD